MGPLQTFLLTTLLGVGSVTAKLFDDSILLKLQWSGDNGAPESLLKYEEDKILPANDNTLVMSTVDNEKYVCSIPKTVTTEERDDERKAYKGPSPQELLEELHRTRSCSYRIEMYWTYELCHGRHIRQYHEEKEQNQRISLQEYYLGQFAPEKTLDEDNDFNVNSPPKRKVDDLLMPYYPVKYVQGTVCDITKKPRVTTILYVCVAEARNQIFSLTEIASCEYEIVVLTNTLCAHPAFQPEQKTENTVNCYPLPGSPPKPTALTVWEREHQWEQRQMTKNIILGPSGQPFKPPRHVRRTAQPIPDDDGEGLTEVTPAAAGSKVTPEPPVPPPRLPADDSLLKSFLSGHYCLYGGSGWWKHEYCHTKQVVQFHEDPQTGSRTDILLGKWSEEEHLQWLASNPQKKPRRAGQILQVSHFYSHGDVCDISGVQRSVEVRLKCRDAPGNPNAVTLFLLEPKPCEYIMGVESPMFCEPLQHVDENGFFAK